ncbi:MAG: ParB/RepB/Spo0J family partition protein [Bacteroidota bacterium]
MSNKRNALGKGLSALLENPDTDITSKTELSGASAIAGAVANIDIEKIEANTFQPRTSFDEQALMELSQSIKEQGIIQPITVRKLGYDKYQLISGERRYKASVMAGLKFIPAFIRIANDQAMLEMALVENIQRENLNAIEIAISYKRLIDECTITQEELCTRVGKNRTTVVNYLRLLKLPPEIQIGIRDNIISMGHARAIINVDDVLLQLKIYNEIVANELSVRKVEEIAKTISKSKKSGGKANTTVKPISFEYKKIQDHLSSKYETKIELKMGNKGKGSFVIPFFSDDDFERILELLNK